MLGDPNRNLFDIEVYITYRTFLSIICRYGADDLFDHSLSIDMILLIMLRRQPKSFKTLGLGLELGPHEHMYRLLSITYRNLVRN